MLLSVTALLACPAAASAANQTVQADDATLSWAPVNVAVMPGTGVMWSLPSRRGSSYMPESAASRIRSWSASLPMERRRSASTLTILNVVVRVWAGARSPASS